MAVQHEQEGAECMTLGASSVALEGRSQNHFVDKHRVELIQRVSNIEQILDELQYKEVIDQEQYDKFRALPTSQGRMRELYSGPLKARKHFVDKHRVQLIQRVSNIAPILDELQYKEVIDQEQYDKIRALPTSQDRMRELYSGPLKASAACKDIFYESLLANEKFLVEDLSKK
uniref:apoptosis-associated speck-like protein containing a CARD n=1 Tax=Maylandia zebra TaxID=106582 RepID=UPI000D2F61D2|nr:apoptosis-associated speck-like protein containing a CARD [Maylandia zebra]